MSTDRFRSVKASHTRTEIAAQSKSSKCRTRHDPMAHWIHHVEFHRFPNRVGCNFTRCFAFYAHTALNTHRNLCTFRGKNCFQSRVLRNNVKFVVSSSLNLVSRYTTDVNRSNQLLLNCNCFDFLNNFFTPTDPVALLLGPPRPIASSQYIVFL